MDRASAPLSHDAHFAPARAAILKEAILEAPYAGWSVAMLRRSADKAGVSREMQRLAFPRGVVDLVSCYSETADRALETAAAHVELRALKIRERIACLVRLRLESVSGEKAAVKRALDFLAMPMHMRTSADLTWRTVDLIWRLAGDTSADFNFYSKRAILAGVYGSTLLYFIGDEGEGHVATWAFLDRRIGNVMQFEKVKGRAKEALDKLPSPLSALSRLRYPDWRRR